MEARPAQTNPKVNSIKLISKSKREEMATEADSNYQFSTQSHLDIFNSYMPRMPNIKEAIDTQHSIAARITGGTFTADKVPRYTTQLIRLISNCLKVVKNYQLAQDLKIVERVMG